MVKLFKVIFMCLILTPDISTANGSKDTMAMTAASVTDNWSSFRQSILDSMMRARVQEELKLFSGDKQKTKQLEDQLKMINSVDSLRKVKFQHEIDFIKANSKGFPVVPFRDTLFSIYTKIGSFKAEERAKAISNRIKEIEEDPFFDPDSIKLIPSELGTEIQCNKDMVIMVVTKMDAAIVNKTHFQLASEYLVNIKSNIRNERTDNSFAKWLKRIGLVILIIFSLSLIIFIINKAFRWLNKFLTGNRHRFLNGFSINKVKIFTPAHYGLFVMRLSNILRIFAIIAVIYLSLPLLFSLFPATKTLTNTLISWILSPARKAFVGIIGFMPNLFSILVIIILFVYSIKGIKYFVEMIEKGEIQINGFHEDWAQPTFRILKFLLYAFMLVLIYPLLPGSGSSAFQGVSVFIGVLFSLGSSSAIANMVAGLVITYMRQFKIGDSVKIGDVTGEVMEKTMLVTRIRTVKNEDVTVPNSTVLLHNTTNYSSNTRVKDSGLIIYSTVTIGYDAPWQKVHQALIDAALRTDLIMKKPSPFVLQTSLDDFYVSYQINAYTKEALRKALVYSQLHQNIQDCFNEAGIEIMSPHYRGQRDGNMTTIPADYLDKNYEAPAFKVNQVKKE
jgi:small-conductance mechanosensitive channel